MAIPINCSAMWPVSSSWTTEGGNAASWPIPTRALTMLGSLLESRLKKIVVVERPDNCERLVDLVFGDAGVCGKILVRQGSTSLALPSPLPGSGNAEKETSIA